MLKIENVHATVDGKEILNGLTLEIGDGEVHAIMGPNGSGKSTLSYVLTGRAGYEVTEGSITYNGQDVLAMKTEERAAAGLFLAMQMPVEIPGVTTMTFLKAALNAQRRARGDSELDALSTLRLVRKHAKTLNVPEDMLKRALNVGFSGGEKKRIEVLQMALFEPKFAILDELDSGLDIDALKMLAEGVNTLRAPDRSTLVITHYQRLLDYIVPTHVHVLAKGRIVKHGGPELAKELEETGYADVLKGVA
ncbi:MAG: Fe-S cluster assembly ATPase SufC [Rhizomicrobium sp.]